VRVPLAVPGERRPVASGAGSVLVWRLKQYPALHPAEELPEAGREPRPDVDGEHLTPIPGEERADDQADDVLRDEEHDGEEGGHDPGVLESEEDHRPERVGGDPGEEPGQPVEDVGVLIHYLLARPGDRFRREDSLPVPGYPR
jgi:hypothetical protein